VPVLEVSRWLGHASITETTNTYGHLLPETTQRTREALDQAWGHLTRPNRDHEADRRLPDDDAAMPAT
jgi:hypothetical protein